MISPYSPASPFAFPLCLFFLFLLIPDAVQAALPKVDFDRMGKVGLGGSFAGLDLFSNSTVTFDPTTSTLLSRSSNGSLTQIGSTNAGGTISAGCALDSIFYVAGSFSSIGGASTNNVASYDTSTGSFTALGSSGPNGAVHAVFCDAKDNKLWVGGHFSSPGANVAVWDVKANSWAAPPFGGLSGAGAQVLSLTTNSSQSSIFLAGSFIASFGSAAPLNGTNNPNVPFSAGATPFSSSLVPVPLQNAQIEGSPSSSDPNFSNIQTILCPSGGDGPGQTWLAADGNTALVTVRAFASLSAGGIRLGNTLVNGRGTTGFSVTTIPDNTVQTLQYFNPITGQNQTCSTACPLLTDSSIPYQDFLFDGTLDITGVQIQLSAWQGAGPGLHLLQVLSSGAFASAVSNQNGLSCFAPNASTTTTTGTWIEKDANTNIPGTVQAVLVSDVNVGTPAAQAPSFTWMPYVSASGQYDINLLVPGCTAFQDCASRTTVKVTVFPGQGLEPWVSTISQQNTDDTTANIYSGPVIPSSPNFVMTVTMTLADSPVGTGQEGIYELVADRVELILRSANVSGTATSSGGSGNSTASAQTSFGFLEWPLSSTSIVNASGILSNASETALDTIGLDLFTGLGGVGSLAADANAAVSSVAHHSSGTVFLGGTFTLSSGPASGATNILAYKNGALAPLSAGGLNGQVTSLVLDGDILFVGGSFRDTTSGSMSGNLQGVAMYDVQKGQWSSLGAGVNGVVTSLSFENGQVQVAGNFTQVLPSSQSSGISVGGFAVWDTGKSAWVNSGGFLSGRMTFVGNGTSPSKGQQQAQFVAGSVSASLKYGASGFVMLQNGGADGLPEVAPLSVGLDSDVTSTPTNGTSLRVRSHLRRAATAWMSTIKLPHLFSRQSTSSTTASLPPPQPATAPAVLAGAFWTNSSSGAELVIVGGNFSFFVPTSSSEAHAVAIYNPTAGTVLPLQGSQLSGVVRALLVQGDTLFIGGDIVMDGTNVNGLAIYDLAQQRWAVSDLPPLQSASGSSVSVRSLTTSASAANTVTVAGSFSSAGSLPCHAICSWSTSSMQWSTLGSGIQGEVASVAYAGGNQEVLVASGSITLADNTAANVATYYFSNSTWASVGNGGDVPGPVTAVEVNNGNASSIFAAGRTANGAASFLSFWNGVSWVSLGSSLEGVTNISQLTMVPLQDTHTANGVIESDRMLLLSGSLADSSFGNASSALFDGQSFIPYIITSAASGAPGYVATLFHSFSTFSFTQSHFLATGVVILISIAVAAGIVFLLVLIGILWALFARRDDSIAKFDPAEDDDSSSVHHRPSSLLAHVNAATRNTILGGLSPFSDFNGEKDQATAEGAMAGHEHDPYGPDASNFVRAETPSDAIAGIMSGDEGSRPAHARYSFDGAGEGELPLSAGQELEVIDDHDSSWWYVRDVRTGREGVVPAAYLY
ncbi:hypothetical protein JAAARDRAFT_35266 [Jaapia argillacea MUCL 33604]|uniref:SH3 domain-containing protein n=1 Tax=Jaapia argillacea MUCL 33604 TaxID=933084 RepID=A0A067Q4P1_9AGAM|nr:hypothetical protein JAAARDRAFT_35266 [Jaapia argillacea MUCL 33604]